MKTKLLLLSFLFLITITAQAQIGTVWSWNFNDNGITDETLGNWTITQAEGSTGDTWALKNTEYSIIMATGNELKVLGSINPGGSEYSRWAITPAMNLSYYTGTKISFTYLSGFFEVMGPEYVEIYAATSPDMAAMLANGPIASLELNGDAGVDPYIEVEQIVDIPEQYNLQTVYFAIVNKWETGNSVGASWALEMTEVKISAKELVAGIDEMAKSNFILKQNPVADNLELQAGNLIKTEKTQLSIYTTTGQLVKQTAYQEILNVSDLQSGIYLLVAQDDTNVQKMKFIKK
ncbi:T9SS type A sorting domain-containing protein [Flavobacterium cerinum]|uniref:T9SS type A sorting domain-containing protein n=1 Tax=Flavobacterium cerinum TaxID=2502784 RepID=A0A3S3Q7N6_9FLAO|nr:T9SS type A sorting domain-containing protein [Flavobacterium cerinum]RWW91946.1 T9SS type A sorting domain-containing protein [Flavobacterium cerinum]